jgi:hypothetical protein
MTVAELIEGLKEALDYDPETGALAWRERPRAHFVARADWKQFNRRFAGKPAGANQRRCRQVRITLRGRVFQLYAHRVIFALIHGRWPIEVDHENGDRFDNRLTNLREAGQAQNMHGYWRHDPTGKWRAGIVVQGRRVHLGLFDSKDAARKAYREAHRELRLLLPQPR